MKKTRQNMSYKGFLWGLGPSGTKIGFWRVK